MKHGLTEWFRLLILAISMVGISSQGQAASRVIISAEASIEYERSKGLAKKDKKTRYHFVEGKFFKGHATDKSLREITFFEIAKLRAKR